MTALKAYTVHDSDECSVVVFAKTGIEARVAGAREMDTDFSGVESCRRFPAVDSYAPGPVPPLVLIEHGWWFECSGCYDRVGTDYYIEIQGEPPPLPVDHGGEVYCNEECYQSALVMRAEKKRTEDAAIVALERYAIARYPGITVTARSAYASALTGPVLLRTSVVEFRFPGGRFSASIREDKTESPATMSLLICQGDQEAWAAFASTLPPAQPPTGAAPASDSAPCGVSACDVGRT